MARDKHKLDKLFNNAQFKIHFNYDALYNVKGS